MAIEDKDGKIQNTDNISPLDFYNQYINLNLDDYVMFMNDPTRTYGKLYEIEYDRSLSQVNNWKYIKPAKMKKSKNLLKLPLQITRLCIFHVMLANNSIKKLAHLK